MNPKAFISYSHDSADFKQWVRSFADRLQTDGVAITLDQYDLPLGDATPHFMEKGVSENDFVLLLVTKGFIDKAASRKGGVGFETDLVAGEIIVSGNRRKFIPILIKVSFDQLPPFLKGSNALVVNDLYSYDKEYETLYRTLTDQPIQKPALGRIRVLERPGSAEAPFDIDQLSRLKNTPHYFYLDVLFDPISLSHMTLPQLFPLYRQYLLKKHAAGGEQAYPFVFDDKNKKTHHPEVVYESGNYSRESNASSFDKVALLQNHLRYSYIELGDDTAFFLSPRFVEGSITIILKILENIHAQFCRWPRSGYGIRPGLPN